MTDDNTQTDTASDTSSDSPVQNDNVQNQASVTPTPTPDTSAPSDQALNTSNALLGQQAQNAVNQAVPSMPNPWTELQQPQSSGGSDGGGGLFSTILSMFL